MIEFRTVIQPDVMSVLIGVNDTCLGGERANGVPVDKYERVYRMFLAEMREANPNLRLVLCHPFVLDAGNIATTGHARWRAEIDQRRAAGGPISDLRCTCIVDGLLRVSRAHPRPASPPHHPAP